MCVLFLMYCILSGHFNVFHTASVYEQVDSLLAIASIRIRRTFVSGTQIVLFYFILLDPYYILKGTTIGDSRLYSLL